MLPSARGSISPSNIGPRTDFKTTMERFANSIDVAVRARRIRHSFMQQERIALRAVITPARE